MQQWHLGINLGQDQSAALVRDGKIAVAIQQERLDRVKYSVGLLLQSPGDPGSIRLPDAAIRYCLDACGIGFSDLATITANMPGRDHGPAILARALPAGLRDKIRVLPSHHLAHAYTAWWPSGLDEALVLVADATGSTGPDRRTESYTLYLAQGHSLTRLHGETVEAHLAELSTLGFVYEMVTRKAGFVSPSGPGPVSVGEAGKLMGLAPYGGHQRQWLPWIESPEAGYSLGISAYDIFLEVAALEKRYDDGQGKPYLRPWIVDLAYKVQHELEEALIGLVGRAVRETGVTRLCLAGGVALNSVANYWLARRLGLTDIFVFPAAGDAGIAAGCALYAYADAGGRARPKLTRADLGRAYPDEAVCAALARFADRIEVERLGREEAAGRAAAALAEGHILARFEGGSELGPRALGQRSILADPAFDGMRDILNARVKFRERFRPFAPVIPEEDVDQVFEQTGPSPFMLLVAQIREGMRARIPAVTHHDGSGRVQTVTRKDNPYMHALCRGLERLRGGPAVLLNTSFNVAGQPIVESPEEALETFLGTDIDYLGIEDYWVTKRAAKVVSYAENLARIAATPTPQGLPPGSPGVLDLMGELDRALFGAPAADCPWTAEELDRLSAEGARFKETSRRFPGGPLGWPFTTRLDASTVLLLDPRGTSQLIREAEPRRACGYSFDQVRLLLAVVRGDQAGQEGLRTERRMLSREWSGELAWAARELAAFGLGSAVSPAATPVDDPWPGVVGQTLAPFADPDYTLRRALADLRTVLLAADYRAETICARLRVPSLAQIEPTRLHYYDRFVLARDALGDLIRLFLLRADLTYERLGELFGEAGRGLLMALGLVVQRGADYAARVDLYAVDGLLVATDHRYLLLPGDELDEDPVMYLGLDSLGLVHTAPRPPVGAVLDLCTGSGVQALVASRYARQVVAVDINPRAVRFARFNAQLNGVDNLRVCQGDLYAAVPGRCFDIVLANPPFVPSPGDGPAFRDGGPRGDQVLQRIVSGAAAHLADRGRLHIVTDLPNPERFEATLGAWWQGGPAHTLILCTADRDEVLFSVAHSHHPFGQGLEEYNRELARWVESFRAAGLSAVNFGYVLVERLTEGSGSCCTRVIHNPNRAIHARVAEHFAQQALLRLPEGGKEMYLEIDPDLCLHLQTDLGRKTLAAHLKAEDNPYFSAYRIGEPVLRLLKRLAHEPTRLREIAGAEELLLVRELMDKDILRLRVRPHVPTPAVEAVPPDHRDAPARIEELESKTTPTCLTSYMRRR